MTAVDHAYAEEHGLVDAYLEERLSESERDAFEAHFFACETCLAQLEMANDFREGMRDVAAEETARASLVTLAAVSWKRRLAWAAALLLLAALPLGLLLARNRGLERELAAARTAVPAAVEDPRIARLEAELKAARESGASDRRRLEDELARARQAQSEEKTAENRPQVNVPVFLLLLAALPLGLLLARNRGLERELAAARTAVPAAVEDPRIARLEAELKAARESGASDRRRLEEELARARQAQSEEKTAENSPQVNVPVFLLAAVRGGDEAGREPVNRIPLPAAGQSVLLTMELATVDFPAFRASLRDGKGQEIWRSSGLEADERDTLNILLPSSMLSPGVYELTIQGEGKGAVIGAYPFRVARP